MRWLESLPSSIELLAKPQHRVHVGDLESNIFDLFAAAHQFGTHFLLRTRAGRLADGGPESEPEVIGLSPRQGLYRIAAHNRKGEESEAVLEIRYRRMRFQTPKGKKKRYPDQMVTANESREQHRRRPIGTGSTGR